MKKRNFKKISLNKKVISNLKAGTVKGGAPSQRCSDVYYEDEDGYIICCTFQGC